MTGKSCLASTASFAHARSNEDIDFDFVIEPNRRPASTSERRAALEAPGFGSVFTDHMSVVRWSNELGWHDARVTALRPFSLDPATAVLHYAQEVFEGMKAYPGPDGTALLFRPEMNARRFAASARRLAMPVLPEPLFMEAIKQLVRLDRAWIAPGESSSLYLRPFMFATEPYLGVRPSRQYTFCVIASPAGPYFACGAKPVTIWVAPEYSRAASGGTGSAKCGGNYAASMAAQAEAMKRGCDQVLFLDSAEHRWIEELGGMNLFFVMDDDLIVTPPLTDTILPGVTRHSVIELAMDMGLALEERPYSFEELLKDLRSGRLAEAFACGTAAVIASIGAVHYSGGELLLGGGRIAEKLRTRLEAIQRGRLEKPGWTVSI